MASRKPNLCSRWREVKEIRILGAVKLPEALVTFKRWLLASSETTEEGRGGAHTHFESKQ